MERRSAKSLFRAPLVFSLLLAACGGGTTTSPGGPVTPPTPTPAPTSPFAGTYVGSYAGTESGSWLGNVGPDGSMTFTVVSPSVGAFSGTGTVAPTGEVTASGTGGGFTATWVGRFQPQPGGGVTGTGTWSSTSGFSGTWAGARR